MNITPGRVAAVLGALAALLGAIAPAVADLDTSSTIGVATGVLGIAAIVRQWLDGWQKYEADVRAATLEGHQVKPATAKAAGIEASG